MRKISINLLAFTILFLTGCANKPMDQKINLKFKPEQLADINQAINKDCNLDLWSSVSVSPEYPWDKFEAEIGVQDNSLNVKLIKSDENEIYLISNLGVSKLDMIDTDKEDVSYFYETTFRNSINLFTLFKESNILIMSKQYYIAGEYGMQMIGKCSNIQDSEILNELREEIRNQ